MTPPPLLPSVAGQLGLSIGKLASPSNDVIAVSRALSTQWNSHPVNAVQKLLLPILGESKRMVVLRSHKGF